MHDYQRFVVLTDSHGDTQDDAAVEAAMQFVGEWKPHIRIHAGDALDLRWLRGRASTDEARERVETDLDAGIEFIRRYRPTHFLFGNHDHRLVKAAERSSDGKLADLATRMLVDLREALGSECVIYPYGKRCGVMTLGEAVVIHGYHSGLYAARQAALTYGRTVIMGHVHANDMAAVPGLEPRIGYALGSLCRLEMGYNEGQANTLRQSHGFAYGLKFPSGKLLIWQAFPVDGKWYFPSEVREVSSERRDQAEVRGVDGEQAARQQPPGDVQDHERVGAGVGDGREIDPASGPPGD